MRRFCSTQMQSKSIGALLLLRSDLKRCLWLKSTWLKKPTWLERNSLRHQSFSTPWTSWPTNRAEPKCQMFQMPFLMARPISWWPPRSQTASTSSSPLISSPSAAWKSKKCKISKSWTSMKIPWSRSWRTQRRLFMMSNRQSGLLKLMILCRARISRWLQICWIGVAG